VQKRLKFPLRVVKAVKAAVSIAVLVKMNVSDGFEGGLEVADACINARAFEKAGADALVISGGFVSLSGFFMLRGNVPLWDMAKALARSSWTKGLALALFGKWLVPEIALEPCFFRAGARAILTSVDKIPVCLLGGIRGLGQMEGAMKEGFAFVQMARGLIREPNFVGRITKEIEAAAMENVGAISQQELIVNSKCTNCNECVISSIDPFPRTLCSDRLQDPDIEDLAALVQCSKRKISRAS